MGRQISVSLLESVVLLNVVKIVTTDHNGSLHFHLLNNSRQNTTSDTDIASKWALLVDVVPVNCLEEKNYA